MCKASPIVKNNQGLDIIVPAQNIKPALFKKKLVVQYPGPASLPAALRKDNMPKPMQINIAANPRKSSYREVRVVMVLV
jgi:hypothetical protein